MCSIKWRDFWKRTEVLSLPVWQFAFSSSQILYETAFVKLKGKCLITDLIEILRGSTIDTVRHLYKCLVTKTGHLHIANPKESKVMRAYEITAFLRARTKNMLLMFIVQYGRRWNDPVDLSIKKAADSSGLISQTRSHQTVAANFYYSLADLMGKLLCGEPHFVRCIKPNDRSLPQTFDSVKVRI